MQRAIAGLAGAEARGGRGHRAGRGRGRAAERPGRDRPRAARGDARQGGRAARGPARAARRACASRRRPSSGSRRRAITVHLRGRGVVPAPARPTSRTLARQVPKDVRVLTAAAGGRPGPGPAPGARPSTGVPGRCCSAGTSRRGSHLEPRSLLIVARGGWTLAVLKAPFGPELGTRPRGAPARGRARRRCRAPPGTAARWTARRSRRRPASCPRGWPRARTSPFPPEFTAAVEAYRAGPRRRGAERASTRSRRGATAGCCRPRRASTGRSASRGAGKRDAARRILLRTGDSRFEDAIDRLLETVAALALGSHSARGSDRVGGSANGGPDVRDGPRGDRDEVRRDRDRVPAPTRRPGT